MPLRGHLSQKKKKKEAISPPSLPLSFICFFDVSKSVFFQVLIPDLSIVHLSFHTNFISELTALGLQTNPLIHSDLPKTLFKHTGSYVSLISLTSHKTKFQILFSWFASPYPIRPHLTMAATCSALASSADSFLQSGCSSPTQSHPPSWIA